MEIDADAGSAKSIHYNRVKTEILDLASDGSDEPPDTITAELTYPDNGNNFPILLHPGSDPTMSRVRDSLF